MKNYLFIQFVFIQFFFINYINGQINAPPDPCTNGSQNTCKCQNSPVLCTIDALDGYTYSMTNYLHQSDGPGNPMCSGGFGTTAHNPTWFRFIAWCPNITLTISATNCNHPTGFCNSRGIQLAVFPECDWQNPNNSVACEVNDCIPPGGGTSQTITATMTGLTVGKIYSMVVDGCCNSACDVEINVTSPPCAESIGPWTSLITGPADVCVGDAADYFANMPLGGTNSTWVIKDVNGNIITTLDDGGVFPGPPIYTKTRNPVVWNTVGTFQICVDAYNACVPVGNDPPELCKTIHVYDVEAGNITATVATGCPDVPLTWM